MSIPRGSGFQLSDDPSTPLTSATVPFRTLLPPSTHPRIAGISSHTAQSWCESRRRVEAPAWLINRLDKKNIEEYKGFSSDGKPDMSIFKYKEDEGAPVEEACEAVRKLLSGLGDEERKAVCRGSVEDNDEFRLWSNPELYVNPGGIRMDETSTQTQDLILSVLESSLSPEGYTKAIGCTLTNHFLGQLVNGQKVLNRHSYNFRLFIDPKGDGPSLTAPWGWTFFGHHLCLSVVFVGKRMIIGPTFMGAEPDRIDEGPHAGLRLFSHEEIPALELMRELPEELKEKACLNKDLVKGLSEDRWNPFDERHLGGARQDNRIVPCEGCPISLMSPSQRSTIYSLIETFNIYLPAPALSARMERIKSFEDQTYFSWIGGWGLGDAYYYRIHGPMTFCEFDFHCGIFLTNTSPAKCHIHTVNRLPNCEDYGKALIAQYHREQKDKEGK